jgi:hypothetical protein
LETTQKAKGLRILEESWDYLIILDACRYDYFERFSPLFLRGSLEKRRTAASCTPTWRDENFPGFYEDIVYITSSPMVSAESEVYGYKAGDHFKHIEQLWTKIWDKELGTVLAMRAVEEALKIIQKPEYAGKRFIIHLMQPHAPYVCSGIKGYDCGDIAGGRTVLEAENYNESKLARRFYNKNLSKLRKLFFLSRKPDWAIRKLLHLAPQGAIEAVWRVKDVAGLRSEYEKNLLTALAAVRVFADNTAGRLAVAADHGELLGEDGMFGHPDGNECDILMDVPWFIAQRETAAPQGDAGEEDEQSVAEKLGQLGYL